MKRFFPCEKKPLTSQRGFTLVELLTVITIMGMLSTLGIASFLTFSRTQELSSATQDVVSMLQLAKSSASSQLKPSTVQCATGILGGYDVTIEISDPAHESFSIIPVCDDAEDSASRKVQYLPKNVTFSANSAQTIRFHTITGNVTFIPSGTIPGGTEITLNNTVANLSKKITIFADGRVQVQ